MQRRTPAESHQSSALDGTAVLPIPIEAAASVFCECVASASERPISKGRAQVDLRGSSTMFRMLCNQMALRAN